MSFEILLSAMHLKNADLANELNIRSDAVIINQCDAEGYKEYDGLSGKIRMFSTVDRGLSKSRNMAIREAKGDICILCDNDVVYADDAKARIMETFNEKPDADIIVFFIKRPERQAALTDKLTSLNYALAMKIFSPEIAFRKKSLSKHSLTFNESFGAGARYGMGEENIFLFKALGLGMKIYYCPVQIAELKENESTWFHGYTEKFFYDRGANYYAMTKRFHLFLIVQFAIRKWKLYHGDCGMLKALRFMLKGAKDYRVSLKTDEGIR